MRSIGSQEVSIGNHICEPMLSMMKMASYSLPGHRGLYPLIFLHSLSDSVIMNLPLLAPRGGVAVLAIMPNTFMGSILFLHSTPTIRSEVHAVTGGMMNPASVCYVASVHSPMSSTEVEMSSGIGIRCVAMPVGGPTTHGLVRFDCYTGLHDECGLLLFSAICPF